MPETLVQLNAMLLQGTVQGMYIGSVDLEVCPPAEVQRRAALLQALIDVCSKGAEGSIGKQLGGVMRQMLQEHGQLMQDHRKADAPTKTRFEATVPANVRKH